MDTSTTSGKTILLSFFPLIEDGLVNVISQLGSKRYTETMQKDSDFVDEYPRSIIGYSETVDLYVSYGKKSSEISVPFLVSILPNNFTSPIGFNSDLYTKLMNHVRSTNANQSCSQNLIDMLLILFFADCSSQILSYFPNLSIYQKLIKLGNLTLDEIIVENETEKSLKNLIIRQFSVIFSFLSLNHPSDLINNFTSLNSKSNDVLVLHRFLRLTVSEILTAESISDFLNSLLKLTINNEWAKAITPIVMQITSGSSEQFKKFLNDLSAKLKPLVYGGSASSAQTNNKNKKTEAGSGASSDSANHDLIKLFAIVVLRDSQLTDTYYQNFLDNVIVDKCLIHTLGCLEAFLAYLRGQFVSKANLFWEWGKFNAMSHPGIEATHINHPDMDLEKPDSFASIFLSKIVTRAKVDVYPEIVSDILVNFAARDFMFFMKTLLPTFIKKLKEKPYFASVFLCLNKIVDPRLRFSEWAQENPKNQGVNIGQTIPLLFLQLKPTLFMLAQKYDLKKLTNEAFSFNLVDSVDYPILTLPVSQVKIAPELKERIRKQYSHQMYIRHLVLEAGEVNTDAYNIDTQPKPIAAIENSESDDEAEEVVPEPEPSPSKDKKETDNKNKPDTKNNTTETDKKANGNDNNNNKKANDADKKEYDADKKENDINEIKKPKEETERKNKDKLYDVLIKPRRSITLSKSEETYIQILSFFPRIMNKSDFLSKIGEQLFNSMVSDCPAVSLYSIMVVNQLFNAKPDDRIHIIDALMEKIFRTKKLEHLFVFVLFFIKLLDLSFTPKCKDKKEIYNFIQKTEALCIYLMTFKSNVITTLAEALSERIYKFANGMRMQSCLYSVMTNYQDEINQTVASKLKMKLLLFNSKTSRSLKKRQYQLSSPVLFVSNFIEIMNLMCLKAPVEFFEFLNEIVTQQLRESKSPKNKCSLLIPFLVRYADENQITNIKNFLSSNKIINTNNYKFKKTKKENENENNGEEEDTKEQIELKVASYSEYYPISIFDVNYSDQKSKDLQKSEAKYIIENAKDLRSIHWTAVILLLSDLYDQLDQANEDAITNKEMNEFVQIFSMALKATDVRFAIFAEIKVQQSILKLINIYIKHFNIDSNESDEPSKIKKLKITSSTPLVSSFPNFCYIVSRFLNSFIIDNNACSEGPFRRPNHSGIVQDESTFMPTINNLFDYLIYFTNTGLYKYARHAITSILCVFPILDRNEEYMKGKIIRIQIDYPIEDENKINKRVKQDLLSILLQSGNERFVLNQVNRKRMNIPLYSALCANDSSLLPLYIEAIFRCPLLFESLYKYFVGTDSNNHDLNNDEVQFNQMVIRRFAGRLLIMSLFFMMSKKCQIRIKAYNLLKRFCPLFSTVLYNDDKKITRMIMKLQRLEATFMSFSSDSELPTMPLLLKYAQIIASSFTNLIDDIVDSLVECLCSVGVNNGIDDASSLYNYCNYYNYHYYSNNDDFLLNKSEVQSNVLQILAMFLRAYSLDEGTGRFTPYLLIRRLLPIYNFLESNAVSNYYALFDQLCEDSQEKVELVINVALHCPTQTSPDEEFDYSPLASYAVIVHFSSHWSKMIIETLARHLTFSYWYVGTTEKNIKEEKYTQNVEQFYAYYYAVIQALHVILRNSSFSMSSSSDTDNSPFEYLRPFLESTINFCLIFFNKATENLLYDILNRMECPEQIISLLRKKGENNINVTKDNQFELESDSESDSESESVFDKQVVSNIDEDDDEPDIFYLSKSNKRPFTSSSALFTDLPKEFVTFLCEFLKEKKDYGRQFLNGMGNECLLWCCGCGDLRIAGRACTVFSEILRPFDPNVLGKILQSMSFVLKASYLYMSRPSVVHEYITGIFAIFNAAIDKYKSSENFVDTFKMIFSICSSFLSVPYFTLKAKSQPKNEVTTNADDINSKIINDQSFISLNSINTSIELCNAANSVISKFFYYNIVSLNRSNNELIRLLPALACQCATLRPRGTLDAIFLAVFNTERTHGNDDEEQKEGEEQAKQLILKENSSLLCTISFILFLPWLHSAFAAYHNVEPYSSLFTDEEIPIVLQIGYLMGNNDQLPDELCNYLVSTMKEPSKASVEDFVLQAGICIARDKPKAFLAAAPLLIEMAKMVGARIIKLNKGKRTADTMNDKDPDFVVTSFYGAIADSGMNILLNENNNIVFLLAIVVVARSFLEYSKISKGVLAISPLISIVSTSLDSYSNGSLGLINVSSVAQNSAIEALKVELAKLIAAFLSSIDTQKDENDDENSQTFNFDVNLCEYSSWESVSEAILNIMKENKIESIDISPEFDDITSKGGAHSDLSTPLIPIPIDPYIWSTQKVKNLREKMKLVRVKGYSTKRLNIEKASSLQPPDKDNTNVKVNILSKYQQYNQYKSKMIQT